MKPPSNGTEKAGKRSRKGPETPFAERLEYVRRLRGCETLDEFHARLPARGGKAVFSYDAVRTYHRDRNPPIEYLIAVADTFDVRLEWLARGPRGGAPTAEEQEAEERARERRRIRSDPLDSPLADSFPPFFELGIGEQDAIRRVLLRIRTLGEVPKGQSGPENARLLGAVLQGPLDRLGVDLAQLHAWQVNAYVSLLCQALYLIAPLEHLELQQRFGVGPERVTVPPGTIYMRREGADDAEA